MKSKYLFAGVAALALVGCDLNTSTKSTSIDANTTEDQKVAYMIGAQTGGQNFSIIPRQMGEYLDEGVVIQAIRDVFRANKDTNFKLQVSDDTLRSVGRDYSSRARNRFDAARPDSATLASLGGDQQKVRVYVDSVLNAMPIMPEVSSPVPVTLGLDATQNQKFSYLVGVQFANQLISIGEQAQTEFDVEYFILGTRESHMKVKDSTFALQLPDDSLRAIGERFSERMKTLREEAMKKAQEEEAKLKEVVAGLRGDTLPNGMPAKMNFKVKATGISLKAEDLSAFEGKPLLMTYFSATCGHCAHAAPQVVEIAKEFVPKGLTVLTVFSGGNNKSGIRKFMDNAGYDDNLNVVFDESRQFGELYSDGYVPKVYLVNPDGSYKLYTAFEKEKDDLKKEIAGLLAGKNVEWKIEVPAADSANADVPAAPAPETPKAPATLK